MTIQKKLNVFSKMIILHTDTVLHLHKKFFNPYCKLMLLLRYIW